MAVRTRRLDARSHDQLMEAVAAETLHNGGLKEPVQTLCECTSLVVLLLLLLFLFVVLLLYLLKM